MINKVTLVGHLGRDPEIRRLENGTPVGRFTMATSESYKDANGDWQSQTEWHNVTVWRNLAEQAERQLKKGSLVYLEGKLTHRKYTDKNGIERDITEIVPNMIRALEKSSGSGLRESSFPTQEPSTVSGRPYQPSTGNEPTFEVVAPTEEPPAVSDDLPF